MLIRLRSLSQAKKTLILSTVSAILCGVIQSEWIFWIPGAVFGILFAIANFRNKVQISLYTVLSSAIYIGAVQIFFRTSGDSLKNYLRGGFLAGSFGACMLALLTVFMGKISLAFLREFLSTIIGGITGMIFVHLFSLAVGNPFVSDDDWRWVLIPLAFVIWQVPIGWLLTTSIQPKSNLAHGLSTNAPG